METKDDELINKILKKVNEVCPNNENNITTIKLLGFLIGIVLMVVCAELEVKGFIRKVLFMLLISASCGAIKIVKKADEAVNEIEESNEIIEE